MHPQKILVVEDEVIVAQEIKERLEAMGYDVPRMAATGKLAVELAEELKPDLVLLLHQYNFYGHQLSNQKN